MRSLILTPVLLLLLNPSSTTAQMPDSVKIHEWQPYQTARTCINTCLYAEFRVRMGIPDTFTDLGIVLNCGNQPINPCYCSQRLGPTATSYILSCVAQGCLKNNDPYDLSTALFVYDQYCSWMLKGWTTSAGGSIDTVAYLTSFSRAQATRTGAEMTGTTGGDGVPRETGGGPSDGTTAPPGGGDDGGGGGGGGGLDTTAKIALGVGLGLGIPLVALLAGIFWLLWRRQRVAPPPEVPKFGGIEGNGMLQVPAGNSRGLSVDANGVR